MIRVLVPMEAFSHLTLSAAYFALQFARRHPARVFFLILEAPGAGSEARGPDDVRWPELFQQLLQKGREQQVSLEIHHSREGYLPAIRRVSQQYHIDDIIIAVPPVEHVTYPQMQRRIELLRHQGQCHIITVKPKEVGKILQVWAPKEVKS